MSTTSDVGTSVASRRFRNFLRTDLGLPSRLRNRPTGQSFIGFIALALTLHGIGSTVQRDPAPNPGNYQAKHHCHPNKYGKINTQQPVNYSHNQASQRFARSIRENYLIKINYKNKIVKIKSHFQAKPVWYASC
jgi:hypothetical protein